MDMNVTIKRRFKVNGVEYDSIEVMPPEVRQAYERATASSGHLGVSGGVQAHITFNGKTFVSREEMPAAERSLYDAAMAAIERDPDTAAVPGTVAMTPESVTSGSLGPREGKRSALRIVLVVGGLLILLWIVLGLLKGMR